MRSEKKKILRRALPTVTAYLLWWF